MAKKIDIDEIKYIGVYGTLKRGQSNHHLMPASTFEYIDEYELPLYICDYGRYPYACFDNESVGIVEVFKVNHLSATLESDIDQLFYLEGYPDHYDLEAHKISDDLTVHVFVNNKCKNFDFPQVYNWGK